MSSHAAVVRRLTGRPPTSVRTRRRKPTLAFWIGASLIAGVALACVIMPWVWPYSPNKLVAETLAPPSFAHPFGTDELGRDVFVRTMAGGRVDLIVATLAVTASALLGSVIGTAAALAGGWPDTVAMRLVDALIAFPFVILVLAVVLVFGTAHAWGPFPSGLPAVLFALIVTDWAVYARLSRAQALSLRQREFMTAAQTLGFSFPRLVFRHLLPNLVGVIGAYMVTDAVIIVLTTAALPFLGAGIQPPTPEWGVIMQEGAAVIATAWWIILFPGLVLAITAIGLSLLADSFLEGASG